MPIPRCPISKAVRIPGTTQRLFSDDQVRTLTDVGEKSLAWNKTIAPTAEQAAAWNISPDLRGANQIFVAGMKANHGDLPPGMQEWLTEKGAAFRKAKMDARIGASATQADNLGNYVAEGMRKWAGIFAHNPTFGDANSIGDQLDRLRYGLNAYSVEEATVGNIEAFGNNFAGPAERLGFHREPGAATFSWVMSKTPEGPLRRRHARRVAAIRPEGRGRGEGALPRHPGQIPERRAREFLHPQRSGHEDRFSGAG